MSGPPPSIALRRKVELVTVLVGLGAAAASGPAGLGIAIGAATAVLAAQRWRQPPRPQTLARWRLANAAVLVLCMILGALGVPLLAVGLGLVAWLQVHRAWTGSTSQDARVALLLTLLHVLLACILSISFWLALIFALFAGLVPVHLLLAHLEDGTPAGALGRSRRIGGLWLVAPVVLVGSLGLFLTIPRMQAGGVGGTLQDSVVGFSEGMNLGDLGEIKDNPAVFMRVRITDERGELRREPTYFRGSALDHFDGTSWQATLDGRVEAGWWPDSPGPGVEILRQEIVQKTVDGGVLFGVPHVHSVDGVRGRPALDLNGTWRMDSGASTIEYVVRSVVRDRRAPVASTPADRTRAAGMRAEQAVIRSGALTTLPPGLDPRVAELAAEWAAEAGPDAGPLDKAEAIETAMRRELQYTLVPDVEDLRQPLPDFLFRSRRGHCEFFATGLAVMLRAEGIPARVANGFYGGEWNTYGEYLIVRQRDAHAWVEAWIPERGWVQMDATPASDTLAEPSAVWAALDLAGERWERLVLDFDLEDQVGAVMGAFSAFSGGGGGGIGGGAAAAGGGLLGAGALVVGLGLTGRLISLLMGFLAGEKSIRRRRATALRRIHRQARRLVEKRGWQLPHGLPPVKAAEHLVHIAGDQAEPLLVIAWALYRAEYGGQAVAREEARVALKSLKRSLPSRLRPR